MCVHNHFENLEPVLLNRLLSESGCFLTTSLQVTVEIKFYVICQCLRILIYFSISKAHQLFVQNHMHPQQNTQERTGHAHLFSKPVCSQTTQAQIFHMTAVAFIPTGKGDGKEGRLRKPFKQATSLVETSVYHFRYHLGSS